jgi:AraC-like DNA-binding protein
MKADRNQTLASGMLLRLVKLLENREVAAEPLLARVGLTKLELEQREARVPYATADALLELAAAELGADGLGLELALTRIDESYGAAGLLLVTGSTFRSGLARSLAYQRLWGDGERFALLPAGSDWAVRFRHPGSSELASAVTAECALTEVVEGLRALVDADAAPLAVELAHAPLGPSHVLAERFGVVPRFEQPVCRVVIAAELMDRPMHALRDLLGDALERQAARALSLLPARASLRERLVPLLAGEAGVKRGLDEVARSLRMSPRTLQRRLGSEGTRFQELLDRERERLATELERLGVPTKEAAFRLGFQDPSALSRAKRRWRK